MKLEIILAIACTSLCLGERLQRSTVLTDESKRILEHFDFSNFDKQEALNYLDRQRYENQIRGKRSHNKFKRHHTDKSEKTYLDKVFEEIEFPNKNEGDFYSTPQTCEKKDGKRQPNILYNDISADVFCKKPLNVEKFRNKRHRQHKKKRKSKKNKSFERRRAYDDYDEDEEERRLWKRRRRKKKHHYWDQWSEWSPCSVTCGRGRKIRSRKCIVKDCTIGEIEMGEKTCQLPACSLLNKILGFFPRNPYLSRKGFKN